GAEDDRRVERDAETREREADECDGRIRRPGGEEAAGAGDQRSAGEQLAVGPVQRLPEEAAGRQRATEEARPERADGGLRVQLALEEECAPALRASLDDEGRRAEHSDREECALEARQPARSRRLELGWILCEEQRGHPDRGG